MDIEKLIERLQQYSQSLIAYKLDADFADACEDAVAAISTLQTEAKGMRSNWYKSVEKIKKLRAELNRLTAENEKLRGEVEGMRSNWYKAGEGVKKLRTKLEQARAEITRLKHYEDKCHDCPIVCAKTEIIKAHEELEAAQNERNMWKEGMEDCQQSILELEAELEQAKWERDAAVEDLHKLCPAWKWDGQKEG